mmetsp:Transcript_32839/g.72537  ORF Transcript_32839/g.72537 Transcript_32839/m.72537 type:complete len:218 (+) Transcript_32839:322-975(+)|eukprot:CAMPEP_0202896856 /NCGR_PEP_ID=MMETSP1392-20130828/5763_1 /ASSEMBLY_ACC=CAM_ASM_000868 /TAXON_ID=225041 /ORGANISM="Chlamydomonas chlamydogama, Strain SAG 11-48b" /LENGTH=217 /DNA_ID=CAMNT_0049582345 /DNA_START=270 /DNA_END=923 /DNA_ORIENTATION=+
MAALRNKPWQTVRTNVGTTPTPLRYMAVRMPQPEHSYNTSNMPRVEGSWVPGQTQLHAHDPSRMSSVPGHGGSGGPGQVQPPAQSGGNGGWSSWLLQWQPTIMALIIAVALWLASHPVKEVGKGVQATGQSVQDIGEGVKSIGTGVEAVAVGVKDVGTSLKDIGAGMKDIGAGVKEMGTAATTLAKSVTSSKVPPHIALMLGLCAIGAGIYFGGKSR